MKKSIALGILQCSLLTVAAQNPNPLRVNQVGYYPTQEKIATVEKEGVASNYTLTDENGKKVWTGKAVRTATSPWSGKERTIIDFSSVTTPGTYTLSNGKEKQQVIIKDKALADLATASIQMFYMQRTGTPILKEYAGVYARPAGHMDTEVLIHPSAASASRPAGTKISSPGGWYDAGDYNKYIVNSAFAVALMLDAYEMNEEYYSKMKLNIPENTNNVPDVLDELMYNIKWMTTMQDPEDGGVYHKLTTPSFEGFIQPSECKQQRYVVMKTTAAALDFAATMAKVARIYKKYPEFKDFCAKAIQQAEAAYAWAEKNPKVLYHQNEMNEQFKPAVTTGAYDDEDVNDEFFWAATELFLTTRNTDYMEVLMSNYQKLKVEIPAWGSVGGLALYSAIKELDAIKQAIPFVGDMVINKVKDNVRTEANKFLSIVATSCYNSAFGNKAEDFHWASIGEGCCGQGIALLYAYRLTGEKKFLTAALQNADYMLGRNATGYCYVTGFGTFSPKNPHQRLSFSDGIAEPQPGLLVGGPNPGMQDKNDVGEYKSSYPDEAYMDVMQSYASNEIAINWNASLMAFIGWLDAELSK